MLRKPGFPVANCNIKMPDNLSVPEGALCEEDSDQQQRRLQLINFGHSQWGFNNWNWAVTKQELDFVDLTNGKYCAGVVAFVSVSVKNLDIHRENIGYATTVANTKGFAIYKSRKCAVTNALRETLLSFGGSVAAELQAELELQRGEPLDENNQNHANKPAEPKNQPINQPPQMKKEEVASNMRAVPPAVKNAPVVPPPVVAPAPVPPAPLPANARAAPRPPPPAQHLRPNSNVQDLKLEDMTEEEARVERKRRQRLAQEEFRQKQLMKQNGLDGHNDQPDLSKHSSSVDRMLLEIPTQEIVIEETVSPGDKRKSPGPDGGVGTKRRAGGPAGSKLHVVTAD